MKNINENEWLRDYEEFVLSDSSEVPEKHTQQVLQTIQKLLSPKAQIVFFKILVIHILVGYLSLAVCHQFGMNPFNTEKSLADLMMNWGGHYFCMFGCGITFVSLSLFTAGYFLTIEEVRVLRKTELLQTLVLGVISLSFFIAFGVELAFGIAAIWLFGGVIGGFAATEVVWKLKQI